MTLHIQISEDTEARLRERAAAEGKDVASFVLCVVEDELSSESSHSASTGSAKQRIEGLRAWSASHTALTPEANDSRESIYEGRGE